jgi:hypothetical protein
LGNWEIEGIEDGRFQIADFKLQIGEIITNSQKPTAKGQKHPNETNPISLHSIAVLRFCGSAESESSGEALRRGEPGALCAGKTGSFYRLQGAGGSYC